MVKVSNTDSDFSMNSARVNGYQHQDKLNSSFCKNMNGGHTSKTNCMQANSSKLSDPSSPKSSKQSGLFKSNKLSQKENLFFSKSPTSSPEKSPFSNGMYKVSFESGSPKWNDMMRSNAACSSIEQSPVKSSSSSQDLFKISKQKAQPVLYRKMFGVFKVDHDVLARWSDGLYYLGIVKQVDDFQHRCYVQFEDKSKCWVHFKDLQPIIKDSDDDASDNESDSDVTCAICRDGKSEQPNEIVLCDKCGQGFHQLCHVPAIDTQVLNEEDETWQCRTCVFAAVARKGGAERDGPAAAILKQMKEELPYDINSLIWDKGHRSNTEETYCYCGGPGDWYLKMLQCCRCLQWFHEACLQCLEHPILYGDRFFLFVCSICNSGNEFARRLPMRWVDVVHLVLYNITITKTNKYYDFSSLIIPYFAQNWEALRLGELVHEASTRSQLKDRVLETLQNNKTRFQCGNETKKAKISWGLKTRSPPSPPSVTVPTTGVINEKFFQAMDLRHGSLLLTESPTPKRTASCDLEDSQEFSLKGFCSDAMSNDLPARGDLCKVENNSRPNTTSDNIFERFFNIGNEKRTNESRIDPPRKRKRGRPRKESKTKSTLPVITCKPNSSSTTAVAKIKKKDSKIKKVQPVAFASENLVIPISELFRDIPGSKLTNAAPGKDAYDEDLRRTMARYFGAEGRIALGERFNVLAKRVVPQNGSGNSDGTRVEYLIEWEGCTAKELQESVQKR